MSNESVYDPNEELPSPSIEVLNQMLNKISTPTGVDASYHYSLGSPLESKTLSKTFPFENHQNSFNTNKYQRTSSFYNLGTTLPSSNDFEATFVKTNARSLLSNTNIRCNTTLEPEDEKLLIIAEPKAFYRDRYSCEVDPTKSRAQRFIRAEDNQLKYEYPTVKV
ncbi:unnamed protein product, partial [Rotaria sp. Silwood2]